MYSRHMFSDLMLHGPALLLCLPTRCLEMHRPEMLCREKDAPGFNRQVERVVRSGKSFLSRERHVSR
jgi:hypothetical protein